MDRSQLWGLIGCVVVELKMEENGFMLISLRIGLVYFTDTLNTCCVCVGGGGSQFLGARDGV